MASLERLIFPPCCLACHSRTNSAADTLCPECREKLVHIKEKYCRKCGSPLKDHQCYACSQTDYEFAFARSAYVYQEPVQALVHALKYSSMRSPVAFFVEGMLGIPSKVRFAGSFDYVTAVPLHRVRKRSRGYNQSELLARKVAKQLGLPYQSPVYRRYYTKSQTNLSWDGRKENLRDAFAIRRNADVKGKNVILVDDVFTSGTTVNEIARVLKTGGAKKVAVLTATRAV